MRETCNKLIHAKRVEWDRARTQDGLLPLSGRLYLSGDSQTNRQTAAWTCMVDVERFCIETSHLY